MKTRNKSLTSEERTQLLEQEHLIADATELICELLERENLTRQQLAERLGKSKGHVTQLLSGERNMTLRTLADVAAALGHRFELRTAALSSPRTYGGRHEVFQLAQPRLRHYLRGWGRSGERPSEQGVPDFEWRAAAGKTWLGEVKHGGAMWLSLMDETSSACAKRSRAVRDLRTALAHAAPTAAEDEVAERPEKHEHALAV